MRVQAWLSDQSKAALSESIWLSAACEWRFIHHAHEFAATGYDLALIELTPSSDLVWLAQLPGPIWCFDGRACATLLPQKIELFSRALSVQTLSERLLAWLWVQGFCWPACLARQRLILANGRLSLRSFTPTHPLQLSVSPIGAVGGDIALYFEQPLCRVAILADAMGHGEDAALDAALFALGAVQCLNQGLNQAALDALALFLNTVLAEAHFVAAAFIEVHWPTRTLTLFNAGMPDILCLQHDTPLSRYPAHHPPLGLSPSLSASVQSLALSSPSQWILHSDGVNADALLTHTLGYQHAPSPHPDLALPKTHKTTDDASQIVLEVQAERR